MNHARPMAARLIKKKNISPVFLSSLGNTTGSLGEQENVSLLQQ